MKNIKTLGERIKELRIAKGYTQDELAKMMGYTSRSTINKIEKGLVDISQSKILDFAQVLDTMPTYLLGWEHPMFEIEDSIIIYSNKFPRTYTTSEDETEQIVNFIEKCLKDRINK